MATPCPPIQKPEKADYDEWEDRYVELAGMYGTCAARHRKTVESWPK